MELVNRTSLSVSTLIAESIDPSLRSMLGIAKATFGVSSSGNVTLDKVDPMPVYTKDVETRFGILPREDIPRLDPVFEVMVLGSAYAPQARAVTRHQVSLQVGHIEQTLLIHGDRHWLGDSTNATISDATPFTRMPLNWNLAFGGTEVVEIDEDSFVDVADPVNPVGKGFHYLSQVDQLAEALKCPDGYPRYRQQRELANIEHVDTPVTSVDDSPLPVCWAPCAQSSGMIIERMKRAQQSAGNTQQMQSEAVTMGSPLMLHRAHPDWVIEAPIAESMVRLEGMTPEQVFEFRLPAMRVLLDVTIGSKTRKLELHPNALTLFPDLRKFTVLFRGVIPYRYRAEDQRSARVRLLKGWQPAPRDPAEKRRIP